MKALDLALAISSCAQVNCALNDPKHPCSKVVNWQADKWKYANPTVEGSPLHRPEAWTGDLEKAPMVFVASNPSFDGSENFPNWQSSWSETDIAQFGAHRFEVDRHASFGATDGPTLKNTDRVVQIDGNLSMKQVKHWQWVRGFAATVLGKAVDQTSAVNDYVMTELVHCKSPNEQGVVEALNTCKEKWFDEIMALSPAKLIFVAGVKTARHFASLYPDQIPDSWGSWSGSKDGKGAGYWPASRKALDSKLAQGGWTLEEQKLNTTKVVIGGMERTVIFIARPGGGGGLNTPWNHNDLIHPDLITYWRTQS
jgi:hypothetical protein